MRRVAIELEISSSVDLVLDDLDHLSNLDVQEALSRAAGDPPAPVGSTYDHVEPTASSNEVPTLVWLSIRNRACARFYRGRSQRTFQRLKVGTLRGLVDTLLRQCAGHPQLAHALILGLKDRGWPYSEYRRSLRSPVWMSTLKRFGARSGRGSFRNYPPTNSIC